MKLQVEGIVQQNNQQDSHTCGPYLHISGCAFCLGKCAILQLLFWAFNRGVAAVWPYHLLGFCAAEKRENFWAVQQRNYLFSVDRTAGVFILFLGFCANAWTELIAEVNVILMTDKL